MKSIRVGSRDEEMFHERKKPADRDDEVEQTTLYTRMILEFLGVWPLISDSATKHEKLVSMLFGVVCLIGLTFNMIPTGVHVIGREKNPTARLMLLGPLGSCVTSFLKYLIIIFRSGKLKSCLKHVEIDWTRMKSDHDRDIMRKYLMVGRGLTLVSCAFMYTGGMSYHTIMPILKGPKIDQFNRTIRPLVYPGFDIFVEPQKSPNYEIIFFTTCVSAFVRYTVAIAGFNFAAVFVTHACGQGQIVISRLNKLFDGFDSPDYYDRIRERISVVVRCHVSGMRLSSRIDDSLREICLVEVLASTLSICLLEYYCMTEWKNSAPVALVTYFVLLISYVFNIFIFCHIGELLQEQYQRVGKAAYMIEWHRLPNKHGLALVMVMAMASYPRKLTGGRIMDMSIRQFATIIKTSATYLSMLRATTA